ncbi:Uncharacterised protein [Moraxella ovis]|uniref:Uncharacterized protein n=1 Tax=Moraxella ovis TaxID=29433 RepID=A0A378PJZ7_9GAMM|nr:Uncharacterised protein [Moraxella ovis]
MEFGFGFAVVLLISFLFFKKVVNKLNSVLVEYLNAAEKHAKRLGESFDKDE